MRESVNGWSEGGMNIIDIFFGLPDLETKNLELRLHEERAKLGQSRWCQNHLFLRFLLLNQLNRTALKLRSSSIFIIFEVIFHF